MARDRRVTSTEPEPSSLSYPLSSAAKMSKAHVQKHFESFIKEILRRIPAKDRRTLTTVVVDSREQGTLHMVKSLKLQDLTPLERLQVGDEKSGIRETMSKIFKRLQ